MVMPIWLSAAAMGVNAMASGAYLAEAWAGTGGYAAGAMHGAAAVVFWVIVYCED